MHVVTIRPNLVRHTFDVVIVYPTHKFFAGRWFTIEQAERAASHWRVILSREPKDAS